MPKLIAGFAHVQRGTAHYRGVLRVTAKSAPRWYCPCVPDHPTPETARKCADAELWRREQGGREVIVLRRCGPCDRWWPDGPGAAWGGGVGWRWGGENGGWGTGGSG